jgi:hypothetical protein
MARLKLIDAKPVTPEAKARLRMAKFAENFPCLRGAPGVSPWDALELDRWAAGPASHSERVTASFVLSVWDPSNAWQAGRFDLMDALRVWDPEHHRAFLEWAADSWWP